MQPGPYGGPPPAGRAEPLTPSGWWYALGIAVGVAGVGIAIAVGVATFTRFVDRIDDFARIDTPGSETVALDAGEYTVFLEYPGADDDFSTSPSVDFAITDPDGDPVELDTYFGSSTYSADSHEGEALYTFTAEESGDYTVTSEGEIATIAIGKGLFGGLVAGIVVAAASAIIGVVAALAITLTTAVKRSNSRTRRHLALIHPPPHPPTPGYPPPGPAGYPPGSYPPGTAAYPPGSYPPGTAAYPPGGNPPGTAAYPPGGNPPGTAGYPQGSYPPAGYPPAPPGYPPTPPAEPPASSDFQPGQPDTPPAPGSPPTSPTAPGTPSDPADPRTPDSPGTDPTERGAAAPGTPPDPGTPATPGSPPS